MSNKTRGLKFLAALMAALLALCGGGALAQGSAPTMHAEVENPTIRLLPTMGYDGRMPYGKCVPVRVLVENDGADQEGVVALNLYVDEQWYNRYEMPVLIPGGSTVEVTLPVKLAARQATFTVELVAGGSVVCAKNIAPTQVISPQTMLLGVLARDPQAFKYLDLTSENDPLLRGEQWSSVPLDVQTFPDSDELMNAFGVIVVDGIDMSALNERQRLAFDRWLRGGGIALVGGGAQAAGNYPFFTQYTGLRAGTLLQGPDVTPALLAHLNVTGAALGQGVMMNDPGVRENALVSMEEGPVLYGHSVDQGVVFTGTFELGARPFTQWTELNAFTQRLLLADAGQAYQGAIQRASGEQDGGDYGMNGVDGVSIPNGARTLPAVALLGGYLLVALLGAYLLLKKLGKREYIWFVLPLLALGCSAALLIQSRVLPLNKPMAATASVVRIDEQGMARCSTYANIATADRGEVRIGEANGMDVLPAHENPYFSADMDEDKAEKGEPNRLSRRFILGAQKELGLQPEAAWTVRNVRVTGSEPVIGTVDAAIWMEEDGLHARVTNGTEYALRDARIITGMGYATLGELLPGETRDAAILGVPLSQIPAANASSIPESTLIPPIDSWDTYTLFRAIAYPELSADPKFEESSLGRAEREARESLFSILNGLSNGWYTQKRTGMFRLVGFNDALGRVQMTVNGEAVERSGHQGVLDAAMRFENVGRTGLVYFSPGMLPALRAEVDGQMAPAFGDAPVVDSSHRRLIEKPVYGFQVEDGARMTLEYLSVAPDYIDARARRLMYNFKTNVWDDLTSALGVVQGAAANDYMGPDGTIFVQFAQGNGSETHAEINNPRITLMGRCD